MQIQWDDEPAQPAAQQPPFTIGGERQPAPRDPRVESRAERAAQSAEEALDIRRNSAAVTQERAQRPNATEANAADFLLRATNANREYETLGLGAPPAGVAIGESVLPDIAQGYAIPEEWRQARTWQDAFITAVLRKESGAAIPESEVETARRIYFPQPGDSQATIDARARARAEALEGIRLGIGPTELPEGVGESRGIPNLGANTGGEQGLAPAGGDELLSQVDAMLRDGNVSASQIMAFLDEQGSQLSPEQAAAIRYYTENRDQIPPPATFDGPVRDASILEGYATGAADFLTGGFGDELGLYERDVAQQVQEDRPLSYLGGQLVAGTALPGSLVATPGRATLTGAAIGGSQGAGDSEGGLQERAAQGAQGAVIGGITGLAGQQVFSRGAQALANRRARREASPGAETYQAAQRQGVDVLPADVAGPTTRRLTSAVRQSPIAAGPIDRAAGRAVDQAADVRNRAAQAAGSPTSPASAGEAVRRGANVFSRESSQRGTRYYDRAHEMAGDTRIEATNTVSALDDILQRADESLVSSPAARIMGEMRERAARGGLTIQGLRDTRTALRESMDAAGLRGTARNREIETVMDAARADIEQSLIRAGREDAVQAFRLADDFWRSRVEKIDDILTPVLGRNRDRSGEQVFSAVERMTREGSGDARRLRQLLTALPEDEADSVRATIIQQMGRSTNSQQDAAGEAFSLGTFLTNWNAMSARGRATILQNKEARTALNDLATIAGGTREAQRYANNSNTSGAIAGQVIVAGAPFAVLEPITATLAAGSQWTVGRMLSSPQVARWLARVPRDATRTSQVRAWLSRVPERLGLQPEARMALERLLVTRQQPVAADGVDNGRQEVEQQNER